MPDNKFIGGKIKYFRNERGLTQKALANLIGKTESSIQKYECGSTEVPFSVLEKIADALNVPINELLDIGNIIEHSQNILDDLGNHPENWITENPLTGEQVPAKQSRLLKHYNSLNESGKDKAIERVEELTEIPRYTKKEE